MFYQGNKVLLPDNVFLAAIMAKPSIQNFATVQAIFFSSFRLFGHTNIFLKIVTKAVIMLPYTTSIKALVTFD